MIRIDLSRKARPRQTQRELLPLKLGLALVSLLATCWLGWALNDLRVVNYTRREAVQRLIDFQPSIEQVEKTDRLADKVDHLAELAKKWRWPMTPLLDLLSKTHPSSLKPSLSFDVTCTSFRAENTSKSVRAVMLTCVATGEDPRAKAEAYRRSIESDEFLDYHNQPTRLYFRFVDYGDIEVKDSIKSLKFNLICFQYVMLI